MCSQLCTEKRKEKENGTKFRFENRKGEKMQHKKIHNYSSVYMHGFLILTSWDPGEEGLCFFNLCINSVPDLKIFIVIN